MKLLTFTLFAFISLNSFSQHCWIYKAPIINCPTFKNSKTTSIRIDFESKCDGSDLKIFIQKKDFNGKWQNKKTLTINGGVGKGKFILSGVTINEKAELRYYGYSGRLNSGNLKDKDFEYQTFLVSRKLGCK